MSQAWSGDISTDDPATCIQDVHIWAPNALTPVPVPQNAKLHFLSLVEVARIPLYLAAGPCCDASTTNEATTRWLAEALLGYEESDIHGDASRQPWWSHSGMQSENGILLKVGTENEQEHGIRNVVTEMLLYAAVADTSPALSTPPASSSPARPDEEALVQSGKCIKVFALPLCSSVIGLVQNSVEMCPPTPTESQSAGQACFLPYTHDPARVSQPASQNRPSISTLFEDATQKRRKFKGRGGESISQAMAGIDRLPSQHGLPEKQETPQPQQNDLRRKSLSRASSISSMMPVVGSEHSRPASRSGPLANGKRSSLHRVESAISPRDIPMLSDGESNYAQQNKAALTKVVMAAMRLHGLQQKKKPPSRSQLPNQMTLHTDTNVMANEAEDEYKLVYHQTFKAAMFTFRKHINAGPISQETMRDIVDRLLSIFCTDPMRVDGAPNGSGFSETGGNNGPPSSSPFDKPSSQARFSNIVNGWNTPTVKKR